MKPKIPVTVLTGFLGSGKTTLLNRILSEDHGLRIAIIENEFGEIGIDQDLVINAEEEVFEMNNGCICCSVRGDLIRILGDLAERRDQFDRVILETTGMADPGPVAQTFLVQEDIQENYELDGIVTLVDAKHVGQHLDSKTDEVMSQVAFADRIILNKVDLISDEEEKTLKNRLQSMNSMAGLYSATMANAPIPELLDIGGFNVQRAVDIKPNFLEPEYPFEWGGIWTLPAGEYLLRMAAGPDPEMSILMTNVDDSAEETPLTLAEKVFVGFSAESQKLTHGENLTSPDQHYQMLLEGRDQYEFGFSLSQAESLAFFTEHTPEEFDLKLLSKDEVEHQPKTEHIFDPGHTHDNEVTSASVELAGLFNMEQLNTWLEGFLIERGPDIYRMKGVVGIEGQDRRFVFQGVHMIFGSQAGPAWGDETPINRLVFIGRNLDEPYIRNSLEGCVA